MKISIIIFFLSWVCAMPKIIEKAVTNHGLSWTKTIATHSAGMTSSSIRIYFKQQRLRRLRLIKVKAARQARLNDILDGYLKLRDMQ